MGRAARRYDVSTMLTLSLTRKQEGWWAAMLARKAPLTLQDCLQGYTQEETLPVHPPPLTWLAYHQQADACVSINC